LQAVFSRKVNYTFLSNHFDKLHKHRSSKVSVTEPIFSETLNPLVRGPLLMPDDTGYDDSRLVWNGMIDKRPATVV